MTKSNDAASAPAQQAAPVKLTRYDRDEGGMFPSESGDWVLYEELVEQMGTPPQPVAAEVVTDGLISELRDRYGVTSNGRGIKEFTQIAAFARAILAASARYAGRGEPDKNWWDELISDIGAIDCRYRGDPSYDHDAYWMREHVTKMLEKRRDVSPINTPSTIQQPMATNAARDVLAERRRQIEAEGWTPGHDDEHTDGEMAYAATSYAIEAGHLITGMKPDQTRAPPFAWRWDRAWWKPAREPRRNLVKAGALILAEIERLDRAALSGTGSDESNKGGSNV